MLVASTNTPKNRENICREIEILRALNGIYSKRFKRIGSGASGIVRLESAGELDSSHMYMILEYCNEGTLATALDPLPFEEKRNRMKETGHILARLHRHGWAHGDVKPGNAGLCRGKVKFFDFGCAESVEFKRPKGSKWAWGTAGFLPPLQHADQQQQTFQETPFTTDVFAFASTLYTIFSKRSLRDDLLQTFPSTDTPVAALFFWGTEPQIFTEIEHTFSGDNLLIHLLKGSLNFKKRFTMERVINHSF